MGRGEWAPFAMALALAAGCGGALLEAKADFRKGRYVEAKERLAELESESSGWDDAHRAEYSLYRGLTAVALGDRAGAGLWLREARAIESTHPGTLSRDDLARLDVALEAYERGSP